jgi:hypothetical protein
LHNKQLLGKHKNILHVHVEIVNAPPNLIAAVIPKKAVLAAPRIVLLAVAIAKAVKSF